MKHLLVLTVAAALIVGCSTSTQSTARLQVYTEHDEATDFSTWKTFRLTITPTEETDYTRYPRYEKLVRSALVQELTDRGYAQAQDGATDFRVAFELVFRGASNPQGLKDSHGVNTDPTMSTGTTSTSTLIIKMLDPRTSEVLWQGRLSAFGIDPVTPETSFKTAVWRVLVEFPPITG